MKSHASAIAKFFDRHSAGDAPVVTTRSDVMHRWENTSGEKSGEASVEGRKRSIVAPLGNAFKTDQTRLKGP